jgi:hypothetical protein
VVEVGDGEDGEGAGGGVGLSVLGTAELAAGFFGAFEADAF